MMEPSTDRGLRHVQLLLARAGGDVTRGHPRTLSLRLSQLTAVYSVRRHSVYKGLTAVCYVCQSLTSKLTLST